MFSFLKLELMNWDLWDHVMFPMDEQVVVVSGPNGSGKTTLLDAIRVLLGTKTLSTSRKMSGYLREHVKVAVIKACVSNPLRRGHGRRPFTRHGIFEDTATIACVLENKSGAWHRRYHILPGDADLEDIKDQPRGMGPEEYSEVLRQAGLPRTLLKVLALEQGETHALCRRSPAQLLEYVLELQGDKQVLDSYEVARENYALSRQEHRGQESKARDAERQLELTARDCSAYEEYQGLQSEIVDIQLRRLPASRWHHLGEQLVSAGGDAAQAHALVERFDSDCSERIAKVDLLEREILRLKEAISQRKSGRLGLLKQKESVDGKAREVRMRMRQLDTLREKAENAPNGDPADVDKRLRGAMLAEADAERRLKDVETGKREAELELGSLTSGAKPRLPRFVGDIRVALERDGIAHQLLAEVIDVTQPRWQKAVESVLGRDRFTVLVETDNALAARKLAAKVRYPAYVASLEPGRHPDPPFRSALAMITLSEERVPEWVTRRLADVRLVESVEDGYELARQGPTITEDGYRQDKRGGVYAGVETLYCGGGAATAHKDTLRAELGKLRQEESGVDEVRRKAVLRRVAIQKELEALRARSDWEEQKGEYLELSQADRGLIEEKRERSQAVMDVIAETEDLTRELATRESTLTRIQHDGALDDAERRQRLVRYHETTGRVRLLEQRRKELSRDVPDELRSEAAGELLESEGELSGRVTALKERVASYQGCTDPTVLDILVHQKAHHDEQVALLRRRADELGAGERELVSARRSYIRVADSTIRRYSAALRDLAQRAGMEVDVKSPKLTEDDEAIQQAGLHVRLGFDGKHPIRISDPKLSGGQKVLASILLLVALTYEGDDEGGGFFILDEPFAHLSVERIDHVARFIGQTRSQFLLTAPTTHNFGVFNAARLVLTLRKKKPEMAAAPPPLFVRR